MAPDDKTGPAGTASQREALRRIESRREAAEGGDGFAVLACIRDCVTHDLVAPEWLAYAFNRHYDRVLNCEVGSWDEAFGKPHRGKKLPQLRQRRELAAAVALRVAEIRRAEPSTPIDEALFGRVGAEFGIGKTLVAELYYRFAGGALAEATSAK